MSASISINLEAVAHDWEKLQESSHLGPIRNELDYMRLVALLNTLLDTIGNDEGHPLVGLLEIVGDLIEAYETLHHEVPDSSPIGVLRFLMEEHSLKQADLPEVGSQGVVSELLSGKRAINARQARLLAERFNVSPAVFL